MSTQTKKPSSSTKAANEKRERHLFDALMTVRAALSVAHELGELAGDHDNGGSVANVANNGFGLVFSMLQVAEADLEAARGALDE